MLAAGYRCVPVSRPGTSATGEPDGLPRLVDRRVDQREDVVERTFGSVVPTGEVLDLQGPEGGPGTPADRIGRRAMEGVPEQVEAALGQLVPHGVRTSGGEGH